MTLTLTLPGLATLASAFVAIALFCFILVVAGFFLLRAERKRNPPIGMEDAGKVQVLFYIAGVGGVSVLLGCICLILG